MWGPVRKLRRAHSGVIPAVVQKARSAAGQACANHSWRSSGRVVVHSYKARMTVLTQGSWELRNSIAALSPFQTLTFRLSTSSRSSLLGLKNGILFGGTWVRDIEVRRFAQRPANRKN